MMTIAGAIGIDIPEVRLIHGGNLTNIPDDAIAAGRALAVRRFDRQKGGPRVHIEDFSQVFNEYPSRKYERASYEDIAGVLWAEAGQESVQEFARRLAFSVLTGNADMHLKNWSVRYEDGVTAKIAPAYDLVPTVAYVPDNQMALSMGGTKDMREVDERLFARFANRAGLPESLVVGAAVEVAEKLSQQWKENEVVGLVPTEIREKIQEHMSSVPLSRNR